MKNIHLILLAALALSGPLIATEANAGPKIEDTSTSEIVFPDLYNVELTAETAILHSQANYEIPIRCFTDAPVAKSFVTPAKVFDYRDHRIWHSQPHNHKWSEHYKYHFLEHLHYERNNSTGESQVKIVPLE